MSDEPVIRIRNLIKSFDRQRVLDDVSLDVPKGETTVVIGPSGCGKTVLLKHMIALLRPDSGEVWFHEQKVSTMSERALSEIRKRIGFLFQAGALFDSLSVLDNVCFPLVEHEIDKEKSRHDQAREMLSVVGLEGFEDRYPAELSGGQRKRVALARAIVLEPEVILYDEPTAGLDPVRADLINELILKLQDILGTTAVVVTHDMDSARKVGDRIAMLHEGRFLVKTTPDRIAEVEDEAVRRFVEGRASPEELKQLQVEEVRKDPA